MVKNLFQIRDHPRDPREKLELTPVNRKLVCNIGVTNARISPPRIESLGGVS
jgi:hypothetical protein